MAANALMQHRTEGRMFVPPSKVAEYEQNGWVVIQPADPLPQVKHVEVLPPAQEESAEDLPADEKPLTVEEAVHRQSKSKRVKRG